MFVPNARLGPEGKVFTFKDKNRELEPCGVCKATHGNLVLLRRYENDLNASFPPSACSDSSQEAGFSGANTSVENADKEKPPFSGFIPIEKLDISYSRSSGPGGQHVNKVNTKVEVRFHVDSAAWIPEWIKPQLKAKQKLKIAKDGYLIVSSDKTRKQILNQADCMERIRDMIREASVRPKPPSPDDLEAMRHRFEARAREVLREKRLTSLTKQSRQKPQVDSV